MESEGDVTFPWILFHYIVKQRGAPSLPGGTSQLTSSFCSWGYSGQNLREALSSVPRQVQGDHRDLEDPSPGSRGTA